MPDCSSNQLKMIKCLYLFIWGQGKLYKIRPATRCIDHSRHRIDGKGLNRQKINKKLFFNDWIRIEKKSEEKKGEKHYTLKIVRIIKAGMRCYQQKRGYSPPSAPPRYLFNADSMVSFSSLFLKGLII
jgi:hypothetical protein